MSRKYELEYTRTALKGIKNLDGSNRKRIRRAIEMLADDPRPSGCVQRKGCSGIWRIRVGDHRIRYKIDDGVLIVLVLKVAPAAVSTTTCDSARATDAPRFTRVVLDRYDDAGAARCTAT